MSHPSKRKGYEAEMRVLRHLQDQNGWEGVSRTGSTGQMSGGPDLVRLTAAFAEPDAMLRSVSMVAVVVPHQPIMYVIDEQSLSNLLFFEPERVDVFIQVKRRQRFVGLTWHRALAKGKKAFVAMKKIHARKTNDES